MSRKTKKHYSFLSYEQSLGPYIIAEMGKCCQNKKYKAETIMSHLLSSSQTSQPENLLHMALFKIPVYQNQIAIIILTVLRNICYPQSSRPWIPAFEFFIYICTNYFVCILYNNEYGWPLKLWTSELFAHRIVCILLTVMKGCLDSI